jgi:Protein of unknown function (DUF429)
MRFVGLDLTDPYARQPRKADVALVDERGRCEFTALPGEDVRRALGRIATSARGDVLIIDGPLALAAPGARLRECERMLATAGKTPDVLPAPGSRPYAGFIRGSVELAAQLAGDSWAPAGREPASATMLEAYPGCSWRALAGGRLPHKTTCEGIRARAHLLRRNGLRFKETPRTHDQLDAALCAWLGWTVHRAPDRIRLVGRRAFWLDGHLREGAILQVAGIRIGARGGKLLPSFPSKY